jgi:hypothetical protein
MANISFIWDGKTNTTAGSTRDYSLGLSSGYANYPNYKEQWTGINLGYDLNISSLPVSGIITSLSHIRSDGMHSMTITNINLNIPKNIGYEPLIAEIIKGADQWFGDNKNNFFYLSVGGDTYNGGEGIDTVDAFLTKSTWVTSATTFVKQSPGVIKVNNFGLINFTLNSVERLKFSDVSVAFDLDANAGKVVKILGAVFGKSAVSNKEYVGIGLSLMDSGMEYKNLMDLALNVKLGSNYTTESAVKLIYSNVFNLVPGVQTISLFQGLIAEGYTSAVELAIVAAETSNNQVNINLVGLSQSGVEYLPVA